MAFFQCGASQCECLNFMGYCMVTACIHPEKRPQICMNNKTSANVFDNCTNKAILKNENDLNPCLFTGPKYVQKTSCENPITIEKAVDILKKAILDQIAKDDTYQTKLFLIREILKNIYPLDKKGNAQPQPSVEKQDVYDAVAAIKDLVFDKNYRGNDFSDYIPDIPIPKSVLLQYLEEQMQGVFDCDFNIVNDDVKEGMMCAIKSAINFVKAYNVPADSQKNE